MHILIIASYQNLNYEACNHVASEIKKLGHSCINPAIDFTTSVKDSKYWLKQYLINICDCTGVFFMPDFYLLPDAHIIQAAVNALNIIYVDQTIPELHSSLSKFYKTFCYESL